MDEHIAAPKANYGFFSLHLCQIKSKTLALPEFRKLPRQESAVRLVRLAVARQLQRQAIGAHLLVDAKNQDARLD